jgi:hypothetical protein
MARANSTRESQVTPVESEGIDGSARLNAHVSDEIVTGRTEPVDRSRFAGFDWVASLLGFAVAVFFLGLFLGVVAAVVGTLGYRLGTESLTAAINAPGGQATVAGSCAAIFVAYLIGGYAAGRLARFSGGRNGLGVVLWTVIVAVALAIAGVILEVGFGFTQYVHLGIGLSHVPAVAGAVLAGIALVVAILGAVIGGPLGTRYHRRVDRMIGVIA